jgi:hypothetical protein
LTNNFQVDRETRESSLEDRIREKMNKNPQMDENNPSNYNRSNGRTNIENQDLSRWNQSSGPDNYDNSQVLNNSISHSTHLNKNNNSSLNKTQAKSFNNNNNLINNKQMASINRNNMAWT